MKSIAVLSIAAVLLSAPAIADDDNVLATPPTTPGNLVQCMAANVGTSPVSLLIEIFDQNGNVPISENCDLSPGTTTADDTPCPILKIATAVVWCKFTVTSGRKRDVRASILSFDFNAGPGNAPSGLPAR